MMGQRKAEIAGQIFIYILGLVIFSMILLYGYKSISEFKDRADAVSLIQIEKDMATSAKKISSDFNTRKRKEVHIPVGYDEVCFIDRSNPPNPISTFSFCINQHAIICDYWKDNSPKNMFLLQNGISRHEFEIGDVRIDTLYFCTNVTQGKIVVQLEGKGSYTRLSEWEGS